MSASLECFTSPLHVQLSQMYQRAQGQVISNSSSLLWMRSRKHHLPHYMQPKICWVTACKVSSCCFKLLQQAVGKIGKHRCYMDLLDYSGSAIIELLWSQPSQLSLATCKCAMPRLSMFSNTSSQTDLHLAMPCLPRMLFTTALNIDVSCPTCLPVNFPR